MVPGSTLERLHKKWEKEPHSTVFMQLADEYRKEKQYQEALHVCSEGLRRHPNYWSAHVVLGRIYRETGDLQLAREELEKVIKAVPDNLLANKLLGDIYTQLGMKNEAIARYKLVQMITPADKEVIVQLKQLESMTFPPPPPEPARTPVVETVEDEVDESIAPTVMIKAPEFAAQPSTPAAEPPVSFSDAPTLPPTRSEENPWAPPPEPAEPAPTTPMVDLLSVEPDPALAEIATMILDDGLQEDRPETEKLPPSEVAKPFSGGDLAFQESDVVDLEPDWEKQKEQLDSQDRTQPIVEKEEEIVDESADELTTLTLAELYESQGFLEKAVRVYQKLLLNDPTNEQIIAKLKELNPADSLLAADRQQEPQDATPEPEHEFVAQPVSWEAQAPMQQNGNSKVSQLSEERRRKITTLENWLATIRRER